MMIGFGRAEWPGDLVRITFGLLALALALTGCAAPRSLYDWGDYEDSLYLRYTQQDFARAEADDYRALPLPDGRGRVPPGLYADYGFLLYRRGELAAAVQYFGKEKAAYPESTLLMDKLIARIRQQGGRTPADQSGTAPGANPEPSGDPSSSKGATPGGTGAGP